MMRQKIVALFTAFMLAATYTIVFVPSAVAAASIATYDSVTGQPKTDFSPAETVLIKGTGFPSSTDIDMKVTRPDGSMVKGDGVTPGYDTITTDSAGNLSYNYLLDGIEGTYQVDAVESATGTVLASCTFTDSRYKLYGWDKVTSSWTTGLIAGWNENDWVDYKLEIVVTENDLASGSFSSYFALWHENNNSGVTGFNDARNFAVTGPAGSWSPDPLKTGIIVGSNIEYWGTFNASQPGTYSLSWQGHLAIGSSNWPSGNIHTGATPLGTRTVPCAKPTAPTVDNPPSVTITNPTDGSYVKGTVNVTADASDDIGVSKVEFYIDDVLKGTDIDYPYEYSWDTMLELDGAHAVKAVAYDSINQTATDINNVTVDNTPPTISDTSSNPATLPPPGTPITITTHVTDNFMVANVYLQYVTTTYDKTIEMVNVGGDTYQATIPGADVGTEPIEYIIKAYDGAGNLRTSGFYTIGANNPPALTNGSVSPATGTTATAFTYSVTYSDIEGEAPTFVKVYIDGTGYAMSTSDPAPNYITGVVYTYSTTLPIGSHGYYFEASDGIGTTTTTTSSGPTVGISDYPPSIPQNLAAQAGNAVVNLTWSPSTDDYGVVGYNVYRALVQFYDNTDPNIQWNGAWTDWEGDTRYSGGSTKYINKAGNKVIFSFVGTGVTWIAAKCDNRGIAKVTVDGGTPTYVDLYASPNVYQQAVYSISGLPDGLHSIEIEVTGSKNASSSNYYIDIDAMDVQTSSGIVRYEETAEFEFVWFGDWILWTSSHYLGGSTRYINSVNSSATFTFTGTGVTWIAAKCDNRGIAKVYVDGTYKGDVDLYKSPNVYQEAVYTISGLANTTHTIKVVVTNNKNPSSNNYYVDVDGFYVEKAGETQIVSYTSVSGTSYSDTTVVNDNTYRYRVKAVDTIGQESDYSSPAFATPKTPTLSGRYEENDPAVKWAGYWNNYYSSLYSGGSTKYSNNTGSYAAFTFTGTSIRVIAAKCDNRGKAQIWIDGVKDALIDLYASPNAYQQVVYSKTGLSYGTHTIAVEVSGQKNPSSSNYYIDVDAFEVP